MRRTTLRLALVLATTLMATQARAVVLDWDSVTWTAGSLSNSYNIDPAVAGNDITVTVGGSTAQLGLDGGVQTPALTQNVTGGLSPAQNALTLNLDLTNQTQAVTITINFSALYAQGVDNVSFSIFDVDFANTPGNSGANFQDQIRNITATTVGGATIGATITTSSANQLFGTPGSVGQYVDGISTAADTTNAGNVMISFGSNAITSLTFTYGSGSGTNADPTAQHIGIGDISFTPVPEMNPAWMSAASCVCAALSVFWHRRKVRKAQRLALQ